MRMNEILKPKTEKEIWYRIIDLSPTEMLLASASGGFIKGVQKALSDGADINYVSENDRCSALAGASENGHIDIVSYLLKRNATICNIALIGVFSRMDLFREMLQRVNLKKCCYLILALNVAEENHNNEIVNLINERINQDLNESI